MHPHNGPRLHSGLVFKDLIIFGLNHTLLQRIGALLLDVTTTLKNDKYLWNNRSFVARCTLLDGLFSMRVNSGSQAWRVGQKDNQ